MAILPYHAGARRAGLDGVADLDPAAGGEWAIVAKGTEGIVLDRFPFEPGW